MKKLSISLLYLVIACIIAGCAQWFSNQNAVKKAEGVTTNSTTQQATETPTASFSNSPKFKAELNNIPDSVIHPYPPMYSTRADTPNYAKKNSPLVKITRKGVLPRFEDIWFSVGGIDIELKITPEKFMDDYVLPSLGINQINELRFNKMSPSDIPNYEIWNYTQYHKGFDTGHHFGFTTKNGYVTAFRTTFDPLLDVDTVTTFPIEQAWDSIKYFLTDDWRKYVGKQIFSSPYDYTYLPTKDEAEKLTYTVKKTLSAKKFTNKPEIQYRFDLSDGSTLWVDAYNGTIIQYGGPVIHACAQTCMVNTWWGFGQTYGAKNFCAELNATTGLYELTDNSRGAGIKTLLYDGSGRHGACIWGTPITHYSNNWSTHPHPEYATAHWALQQAWDYLYNSLAFQTPYPVELVLDYGDAPAAGSNPCNAGSFGNPVYSIEIGNDVIAGNFWYTEEVYNALNAISLGIIGHELSHSILFANTQSFKFDDVREKVYEPAGTAVESFCDILGAAIEYQTTASMTNAHNSVCDLLTIQWSFANPNSAGVRLLPNGSVYARGQAAFYNQNLYWGNYTHDRYDRTSIINHWFYLLTNGTPPGQNKKPYEDAKNNDTGAAVPDGYADPFPAQSASVRVDAIDNNLSTAIDKAVQLVFNVYKERLVNVDKFSEIAYHTLNSAIEKGYNCNEIRSVYNAWRAVGIYPDMASSDITAPFPTGCNETSGYQWDTACSGFNPSDIEFYYVCNGFIDNVYQLYIEDVSGNNGPYTYDIAGWGRYFAPYNGGNSFYTIPLLQDYDITVTNGYGCSTALSATPAAECTTNTGCQFSLNIYAELSICEPDGTGEGTYLNFLYDTSSDIDRIYLTYNGADWTTVYGSNISGSDNFTIYFPNYQAGEYIYYYAADNFGCIAQGSFMPLCDVTGEVNNLPVITMSSVISVYDFTQEICIFYEAVDPDGDYPIQAFISYGWLNREPPTTIFSTGSVTEAASGEFCIIPDHPYNSVEIYFYDSKKGPTRHVVTFIPEICLTPSFVYSPQEPTALYDCNGNLYQPASVTVTPAYDCDVDFTVDVDFPVNESGNHTLTGLGANTTSFYLEFNGNTYTLPITVTAVYDELEVTGDVQPSLVACSVDQSMGQIALLVTGGSGAYDYSWSDCPLCNSPTRTNLCAGSYTVTVTDGNSPYCQTVYTVSVPITTIHPATAGGPSDNTFDVNPTVFSGSTTLTYRVAYNAQVSIAMYNSQGNLVAQPLANELKTEGEYNLTHTPPAGLPQGIYFYVLYVCGQPLTRVAVKVW
ncbi:hypothetical protein C7N43_15410 [Sphingobacteriales bacterium UPWRP_1]|nr:hypothetical protein BVG80_08425 [Sphingobacteriales bacterium TSM_CSM]PSJ76163.1 hypothetical protein C7N43_15410 [Sphingobacteriales bacterium UPWRP_1]